MRCNLKFWRLNLWWLWPTFKEFWFLSNFVDFMRFHQVFQKRCSVPWKRFTCLKKNLIFCGLYGRLERFMGHPMNMPKSRNVANSESPWNPQKKNLTKCNFFFNALFYTQFHRSRGNESREGEKSKRRIGRWRDNQSSSLGKIIM